VPVDREQHRAEHHAVIQMEPVADRGEQFLAGTGWVPVAPGRDRPRSVTAAEVPPVSSEIGSTFAPLDKVQRTAEWRAKCEARR